MSANVSPWMDVYYRGSSFYSPPDKMCEYKKYYEEDSIATNVDCSPKIPIKSINIDELRDVFGVVMPGDKNKPWVRSLGACELSKLSKNGKYKPDNDREIFIEYLQYKIEFLSLEGLKEELEWWTCWRQHNLNMHKNVKIFDWYINELLARIPGKEKEELEYQVRKHRPFGV